MSTNPFVKASAQAKRLKLFIFGKSGVGKTRLALRFPKPCVLDLESGSDLYGGEFAFDVVHSNSADEIMQTVRWLAANKTGYQTLVIDPITMYWEALQAKYMRLFLASNKNSAGNMGDYYILQPQDWGIVKAELKEFIRLVVSLDMHIVCVAREKVLYDENKFMRKLGVTFDGEKAMDYYFDQICQIVGEPGGKSKVHTIKDRSNQLPATFDLDFAVFAKILANGHTSQAAPTPRVLPPYPEPGWETHPLVDRDLPQSLRGQGITLKRLATDKTLTFKGTKDPDRTYTGRDVLHFWAKDKDVELKELAVATLEAFPSEPKPTEPPEVEPAKAEEPPAPVTAGLPENGDPKQNSPADVGFQQPYDPSVVPAPKGRRQKAAATV